MITIPTRHKNDSILKNLRDLQNTTNPGSMNWFMTEDAINKRIAELDKTMPIDRRLIPDELQHLLKDAGIDIPEVIADPKVKECTCDLKVIMNKGCMCGAITRHDVNKGWR